LTATEIDRDFELVTAARRVVELAGENVRMGKFHADLRDNTGVQVGDHNKMTLNIDSTDRRRQ
jgi:hypothetical protein